MHAAQGNGECRCHCKWRDTITLRGNLAMFQKDGYKIESHRPSSDDESIGLMNSCSNREGWVTSQLEIHS